jgi:hypothetical protein
MDFLDPNKNRAHTTRLLIGYILVAIAVAMAALILLFQSLGYDVDRRTGQVIQNGLVFLSTKPDTASIYLNGQLNRSRTNTRLPIPAGQYKVELKSANYRDWKRSFYLEGGKVERIDYPILFPIKLKTADTQLYSAAPGLTTQSPDLRWLLVQQPGSDTVFDNFDLNNTNQAPSTLILPPDLLTPAEGTHTLTVTEWASDNKHVLVKHDYTGGSEYVMLDRENIASSLNINKLIGSPTAIVSLRDKRYDKLLIYELKTLALETYDTKSKQLLPLLQKVISFKSYGSDLIIYSTADSIKPSQTIVKLWDGTISYEMRTFTSATEIMLDITQHANDWYAVVSSLHDGQVYIYENPQNNVKQAKPLVPISVLRLDRPAFVSFSNNTQFVVAQNGSKFAVYDIEGDRRSYYELKQTVPVGLQAKWMDGYHLALVVNGRTLVMDYDGINQQELSANLPGYLPIFNHDYTALYNIAPSVVVPGRPALTRTELKAQ